MKLSKTDFSNAWMPYKLQLMLSTFDDKGRVVKK